METPMKNPMRAAAALSLLVVTVAAPAAALAQQPVAGGDAVFRATTLQLGATGETRVAPDMATIQLGVMAEAPTAQEAMHRNGELMTQAVAAVRRGGVAEKDIRTSGLELAPQYAYGQNQPPRLTGYRATNRVTVVVRDLARLGPIVDAAVGSGANQVEGISFGLADPTAAENAARQKAVQALAAKASLYAQATGYRVLRLVTLSEGQAVQPVTPLALPMAMAAKREATPILPGETSVRVEVSGVYELGR
jgi:uncharacterized protein YggE